MPATGLSAPHALFHSCSIATLRNGGYYYGSVPHEQTVPERASNFFEATQLVAELELRIKLVRPLIPPKRSN